jgi:hypothetical protein
MVTEKISEFDKIKERANQNALEIAEIQAFCDCKKVTVAS